MSGSQDSKAETLATTHNARISGRVLNCALQSPAFEGLSAVSSTRYCEGVQQYAVFDGDQGNARIGTEFVVPQKMFRLLPEDEKMLWHLHNVQAKRRLMSSRGIQQVAVTYGRVVRSLENSEIILPPALSHLLTSCTDAGSPKRLVSFLEDEAEAHQSTGGLATGTRPGEAQSESGDNIAPHHLEIDNNQEDEYLDDAVHRPVVNHRSSHLPALTERMRDDIPFLSETRSTRF